MQQKISNEMPEWLQELRAKVEIKLLGTEIGR
jgi:hypothetical protein